MLLEHTNMVTSENGPRPAGRPDQCYYCGQPVGLEHKADCACRVKVVMIEVTMRIPRVVPASWDAGLVDFHLNDSSWCADNIGDDLTQYLAAKNDDAPCMCGTFSGKFLRDADANDLQGVDVVQLATEHLRHPGERDEQRDIDKFESWLSTQDLPEILVRIDWQQALFNAFRAGLRANVD